MVLDDRVALVTGAGKGIGRATAVALARAGAHVAVVDIDGQGAGSTSHEIAALGRRNIAITADVGEIAEIERMVARTIETFGRIDILVNNAGVTRRCDIMDVTVADWDRIHRVNARGVFFCLQRAAKTMILRRGGRIINIASVAGKGYAGASNVAYAASKGAVIAMTKLAALQLAPYDINVNAICPGVTRTDLSEANLAARAVQEGVPLAEMERRRAAAIPLGRANDPADIAAMAVFLASPGARNITGQSYNVDGGLILD